MNTRLKNSFLVLLIIGIISLNLSSCKKDGKKTYWDTDLLTPIATADLTLQNIVGDSMFSSDANGALSLVYRNTLYSFDFSDYLLELPDTGIGGKFTLDSFNLGEQNIRLKLTLGQMAVALVASGSPVNVFIGNQLISNHGGTMVFPALTGLNTAPSLFDASFYFSSADLRRGYIGGYITNRFPVPLTNVRFLLKNAIGGDTLVLDEIATLFPGVPYYVEYDLSGKHLESQFAVQIVNFGTPGSSGSSLPVDTADYLLMDLKAWGLRATRATAIFPSLDILTSVQEITQNLGNAKLTYLEAESGILRVYITSSVQEQLRLTYILDGAYDQYGKPLKLSTIVPPAPAGGLSRIDKTIDLSGYAISLTGKNRNSFNTYTQIITARTDSSGIMRTITSADSLRVSYSLENIRPKLIKGYAGDDSIGIPSESSNFDFFNLISGGTVDIEDVKLTMNLENGIGVKGDLILDRFAGTKGGTTVNLIAPSVIGNKIRIEKAREFPFTPSSTQILVNNSNSNIRDILKLLPNKLEYGMRVKINPDGNDGSYQDFVKNDSRLHVNLDLEVPLSLIANRLTLSDTVDFDLAGAVDEIDKIKSGTLHLIANNGYPLEAKVNIITYDEYMSVVDTVLKEWEVSPAPLNASCRVIEPLKTIEHLSFDDPRIDGLRLAKKAIIQVFFTTKSSQPACNSYLKIYNDYHLRLTMSGDFEYQFKGGF